eukprot:SAG22_NODE_2069_length_3054_cov_1.465313_5_plen_152_part_00
MVGLNAVLADLGHCPNAGRPDSVGAAPRRRVKVQLAVRRHQPGFPQAALASRRRALAARGGPAAPLRDLVERGQAVAIEVDLREDVVRRKRDDPGLVVRLPLQLLDPSLVQCDLGQQRAGVGRAAGLLPGPGVRVRPVRVLDAAVAGSHHL